MADDCGCAALHYTAELGHLEIVKFLMEKGLLEGTRVNFKVFY